jgi:hypothetical protein
MVVVVMMMMVVMMVQYFHRMVILELQYRPLSELVELIYSLEVEEEQ